jgi:S1-C subfamily serine protease
MAKPSSKSEPAPSSPRPAPAPSANFRFAAGVLKLAAIVLGLPAALLCVMALVGAATDNGYARVIVAAVVVVGLPLVIADRLLPKHDPTGAPGLVSDVCAVTWMAITFGCAAAAGSATRPLLSREGDRLVAEGHGDVARAAYLLAGLRIEGTAEPPPAPAGSGSAAASGSASAGPASDAGAEPTASATATVDAGAPHAKPEKPADKTPADLFRQVSPSVVSITARSPAGEGGGTGFLIDKDGTIATNHHVIENATRIRVKFSGGTTLDEVEILVDDSTVDLALIRVGLGAFANDGGAPPKALPLGDSDVDVGEHVIVIGNPLGLESTLTDGLVSSRRIYENRAWIQFSAPIGSGNSGGPVFNMRGEVIGVATASLSGREHGAAVAQNLNLAVPVNELKKLIRTEYPSRRKLGDSSGSGHW